MAIDELKKRACMIPRKRVTIVDVADALGMTKGTVSRALNGYPDIAESTRMRVRRAAETLGYRALSHAQAIRTGRVRSVGMVLQISDHDRQRPFVSEFLAGISEAASAADWTMTLATATSDDDTLRLLAKLADERKADGFILPRTYVHDRRVAFLREAGVPFVLYGRTADPTDCAWYDIEGEVAMAEAVERLLALGHRRIGHIPGGPQYMYSHLRQQGYSAALTLAGLGAAPELIGPPALTRDEGAASARALLALPAPPTAIVCATDAAAIGAYDTAAALGLAIGSDLSVISYDGLPEGEILAPQLSTYDVDTRRAGARLTELLIRRIGGEPVTDLRELARARFLDRGSHGPALLTSAELAARVAKHRNLGRKT